MAKMKFYGTAAAILFIAIQRSEILASAEQQGRVEEKTDSILALMTLEEKIGQLVQYSGEWAIGEENSTVKPEYVELIRKGGAGSFLNVYGSKITRELQRIAVEETRLKIPLVFGFDVIHGFRTTFPVPLAEASSWQPALAEKAARAAALEASAAGVHWTFAPMVDIARDPRWGRIVEGSGEDPFLGSVMAAARVRGFQGDSLSNEHSIAACPKHFAAYGAAEGGRDYNAVDISDRTLREVYLPPFKAAIDAGAMTIMSAFNEVSGIPSSANYHLLTDILRGEWAFRGLVVSDWTAIAELIMHGFASDTDEAVERAIEAGVDVDMEGGVYASKLAVLVKSGRISIKKIDEAVRRVLKLKFTLGLFDNPYKGTSKERERGVTLNAEHRRLAREIAQRSIVLLKNEGGVLPLRKDLHCIAVVGPLADDKVDPLGPWSQLGRESEVVTVLDGIGRSVSKKTKVLYTPGMAISSRDTSKFHEALKIAKEAEVILAVVGESRNMSGEAASRASLSLPGVQEELLRRLHATGKPIVVVLMNGRPLAIPWIVENIPAVLESWFLGIEAGNAIADVLFGDYNPSGKLPVTFPRDVGQVPIYYSHKNTGRPANDSVRFCSRYTDLPSTPLFPFGYGLSYTKFGYSNLHLSRDVIRSGDSVLVHVDVTNEGDRYGEEVVQLYIRDEYASVTRPVLQLRGFKKIALAPGQTKTVSFTLTPDDLAMYDISMKWIVEPGRFDICVGGNSADLLITHLDVLGSTR